MEVSIYQRCCQRGCWLGVLQHPRNLGFQKRGQGEKQTIQYGYIIEATISYYPIRNGWKLWYGKNGLFYYKSIQDCRSYDLQNLRLKIHNFSLKLKPSKTPPTASCWIISTLMRCYVFFNPRFCKSWDCPSLLLSAPPDLKT